MLLKYPGVVGKEHLFGRSANHGIQGSPFEPNNRQTLLQSGLVWSSGAGIPEAVLDCPRINWLEVTKLLRGISPLARCPPGLGN